MKDTDRGPRTGNLQSQDHGAAHANAKKIEPSTTGVAARPA